MTMMNDEFLKKDYAMKNDEFLKKYYEIMDSTLDDEETDDDDDDDANNAAIRLNLNLIYSERYSNNEPGEAITKFMSKCFPSRGFYPGHNVNDPFVDSSFIKALAEIAKTEDGLKRIMCALEVLCQEADSILPMNPIVFRESTKMLDNLINEIIMYGKNKGLEIDSSNL